MGQPVTTNPLIIMLINMTVVFLVLIALCYVIKIIHALDPTRKKVETETVAAPVVTQAPAKAEAPVVEDGIPGEVIAVIAAALASYGYSASQIKAVRPVNRNGWRQSGRVAGMYNTK